MKNCSDDILAYHRDEVTLPTATRTGMRENRDANRRRLKRGLEKNGKPQPGTFIIQGSYAMKTMTQHPRNDYDIDDGVPFDAETLKDKNGSPLTPEATKEMVRDALIEGEGLKEDPRVKKNCVRAQYAAGHHIDMPVYRVTKAAGGRETKELAGETWRESNPTEITDWFRTEESKSHRQQENEPQLRRLVRLLKRYSRSSLDENSPSGLILTVLAAEQHMAYVAREDEAFRALFRAMENRLTRDRIVRNPAPGSTDLLTRPKDEPRITALLEQLSASLQILNVLDQPNCRRSQALKAWKSVFRTSYFDIAIKKAEEEEKQQASAAVAAAPYVPKPWVH